MARGRCARWQAFSVLWPSSRWPSSSPTATATMAVGELDGPVLTEPALVLETIGRGVRWFEGLGREVFAFLAGIVIWLRGSRWGQRRLRFSEVFASFRWGTVIVSLAALSEGLLDWPLRGTLVAIPFFVVGP